MVKKLKLWMKAAILTICGATVLTACSSNEDNGGTTDDGKVRKALLIILDGWGIGDKGMGDVIARTATPYMDYLKANYPNAELQASGEYVGTAKAMGYDVIITADHGNADHAINADGTPNTAHSTNPVPFIYVTANKNATERSGILADVAPSVLHIMGLQQPKEMTGQCLIKE